MRQYSANRAQRGKTAYRTPSRFIYKKSVQRYRFSSRTRNNLKRKET